MCDLETAGIVAETIGPCLSEYKGQVVLAWMQDGIVLVKGHPNFKQAAKFQDALPEKEKAGSIIRDIPAEGTIMML